MISLMSQTFVFPTITMPMWKGTVDSWNTVLQTDLNMTIIPACVEM